MENSLFQSINKYVYTVKIHLATYRGHPGHAWQAGPKTSKATAQPLTPTICRR
jgi:hypothetical protein